MGIELPLTAARSSRKQAVLEFIKRHYAERGASPSLMEIAAGLRTSKARVLDHVRQLAIDGLIHRVPGKHHGISLPDPAEQVSQGDALRALRRMGWVIDADALRLDLAAVPNSSLPLIPDLDHIPDVEVGGILHDGQPGLGADDRAE